MELVGTKFQRVLINMLNLQGMLVIIIVALVGIGLAYFLDKSTKHK